MIPFKEKLKDLEVWEKESATFQCEVPVPSTETAWFKEETKLRQSKKYNIEEEGTYRRLTVQNVTADDDAVYICEMKEGSRTIAELSVQGKEESLFQTGQASPAECQMHMCASRCELINRVHPLHVCREEQQTPLQ